MTLEQTRHRRQAVGTIHDIVSAMRAIAAGRIQGAQRALTHARSYEDVVLRALRTLTAPLAIRSLPDLSGRPPLLLVLTSEQPLCGSFNEDVLALAQRRWQELRQAGPCRLVVVGERGRRHLAVRGIVPEHSEPAATSLQGVRDLVKQVAALVDQRHAAGQLGPLRIIYSRYQSVSEQVPTEEQVLPIDPQSIRFSGPVSGGEHYRYLSVPALLAGLIGEYAFIRLYRIAADSFASEQASRLIAMDGATRNTERMLNLLLDLERRERQGEITRQVLELIGARFAARGEDSPSEKSPRRGDG
jgi:F-type H+-transporting ATPase subunit gamma